MSGAEGAAMPPDGAAGGEGAEVVGSAAEARALPVPPLLVLDVLRDFLDESGLGSGPLEVRRIGEGKSNVTFALTRGDDTFVLRRGPRPPLPRSAHDMLREARIQRLVAAEGVPVPRILAVCNDESLLGVPFYVMSCVDGVVLTGPATEPAWLASAEQRAATSRCLVDTLLDLHAVDVTRGELAALGRPDGYLERQVRRFAGLWEGNTTRDLPLVGELAHWLGANVPATQATTLVHGDFRLGNVMFDRAAPPRVAAVLDWEMATLGDPLADLGYLVATYADPAHPQTIMELTPLTRGDGYWGRAQLVERYAAGSSLDLSALPWYQALALWKSAIFSEAIYTRWLKGERPDDDAFGPALRTGIPVLLEQARDIVTAR